MSIFWKENLERLKSKHNEIYNLIGNLSVSYIDIPCHYNTGDLLIYLGTEAFFKDYSINVNYRALQSNININEIEKNDVILVHGGGNFGDLYLKHHRKREEFLSKFSHKKIIFMPQSIFFENETNIESTKIFFSQLSDVTLLVRDDESYKIGLALTDNVLYMPDMAHSLHPLIEISEVSNINEPPTRILNLNRKDLESKTKNNLLVKRSFDWGDLCSPSDLILNRLVNYSKYLPLFKKQVLKLWLNQVDYNVNNAINFVELYDIVYTDRLHGFLISYLLGKQIYLLDNSYGKISRYQKKWFSPCSLIKNQDKNR
ncbi:MAG: pyruvyl transferase EpsO [Arcobacteraceae bacterium]|jgi:pyruvyl transferase EpsO